MKKRIFALVMSILLVMVSSAGAFATDKTADHSVNYRMVQKDKDGNNKLILGSYEFKEVASSAKYSLLMEDSLYIIGVKDKTTGDVWYTSPPAAPQSISKSIAAEALSAIVVNYTKKGVTATYSAPTYTSITDDSCKVTTKPIENGIRIDYDFTNYGFAVPVQFTVDDGGMNASIIFSEIKESEENTIVSIDFLKYFAAAPEGTEGYMIVPDGSGAIIKYDNGKDQPELQYSKDIYGIDMSHVTEQTTESSRSETITLPVFGAVHSPIDYTKAPLSDTLSYTDIEDALATGAPIDTPNFNILEAEQKVATAQKDVETKTNKLNTAKTALETANADVTKAQTALDEAKNAQATAEDAEKAAKDVTKAEEKLTKAQKTVTDKQKSVTDAQTALDEANAAVTAAKAELETVKATEAANAAAPEAEKAPTRMLGYLAEVTSGAEVATLKANVSGLKGSNNYRSYNNIYTRATYRTTYAVPLKGQIGQSTNVIYNAQDPAGIKNYTVRYRFLTENADYTSIAAMYRDVLTNEKKVLSETSAVSDRFYVEFYGAVNKKKSFAGIVYNARETLTSFNEAAAILDALKSAGVNNVHSLYTNFADDYFNNDIELNLKASGSLGGSKDLKALIEKAKGMKADVALAADFVTLPSGGNGFSTFFDVADVINISPIKVYPFSINSNTRDTSKKPYYLLKAEVYGEAVAKLQAAASKNGYTSLYFDEEALQLYSDLAPAGYQSDRVSGAQADQFKALSDANMTLTMSNPNAYLYKYADYITDVPVCSSKEILFDGDIPFLQMVLRGSRNFGGESMNITDVSDTAFLRHLEYGTDMKYALINASSEALLKTDHTFLYSATFSNFKDQIAKRYAAFKQLGEKTNADKATIVAHDATLADGNVSVTEYSNGTKVYVNYGSEDFTTDSGEIVKAMNYIIV